MSTIKLLRASDLAQGNDGLSVDLKSINVIRIVLDNNQIVDLKPSKSGNGLHIKSYSGDCLAVWPESIDVVVVVPAYKGPNSPMGEFIAWE